MPRVRPSASPNRLTRRSSVGLAFTGAILVVLLAAGLVQAVAVTVGFRDFGFDPGKAGRATADTSQSKLWFAGGSWYAGLFSAATSNYEIFRHNDVTHAWVTTGDTVDSRDKTNADYLYDGANNKLWVVSTRDSCNAVSNPTPGTCNDAINVYRYTVNTAALLPSQYALDAGFPKAIIGGAYPGTGMSTGGAGTATIARDANRIYVAWTRQSLTNAKHSTTSVAFSSDATGASWSAPVLINQGEDGQNNTSAIVAFGANVGIYYTDLHAVGADNGFFKVHTGGQPGGTWSAAVLATPNSVVDQASAKADAAGNVYVAIKTNSAAQQIRLLKRTAAGVWSQSGVADGASTNTRPQLAIDTTFNGNIGTAIVIMNDTGANGSVYYKMAPLTGVGALVYTVAGKGTQLIESATDNAIADSTTTKQVLTNASGLLVEASDSISKWYLHNHLGLPDAFDVAGPIGTININGNPTPDATKVTAVTLNISATDQSGVVEMRIANSADGTTCPTTGTPALLNGPNAQTFPYATTHAWTLLAGDGVKRVCIQFRDAPLFGTPNWSVPVSDTIRLDTTGPTGTATINGGDASTPIATVSVAVPATDATGVKNVRISNSAATAGGVLTTGTTFPYATPQPWTLTPGDGLKTVYVQWQDALDTWSAVTSDTITLDSDDTTFTAITPVRLLDSRFNNPAGMTIFSSGVPKSFLIAGRPGSGVPPNAVAITGNLTVTGQTAAGFVTLGPDVSGNPGTSTINFPTGDIRANGVFVSLDGDGKLEATYKAAGTNPATKKAHLILDVTGYFVVGTGGNEYFGVNPARYLDTRVNNPAGSHVLHNGAPYGFQVGGRTVGSTAVPADAVAITGNLTVTGQTKGGLLSLTPTSVPNPTTSTLNFPKGDNRANNVTVKLGAGGMLFVVYRGTGTAHAVLDVTGYFRNAPTGGLTFVPLAPTRTVDTRIDQGIANPLQHAAPKSWLVRGVAGVGGDAEAFTGNVTIIGQTKAGLVSVTPTPVVNPNTSTINFPKGDVRANGLAGRINAADGKSSAVFRAASGTGKTEFIVDITGYFH